MNIDRLADYLLEPDQWPAIVRNSNHMPLLQEVVMFSRDLEEAAEGNAEIDSTLHRLLRGCGLIANWLPKPQKGRAPCYTRVKWDLRALSSLIPAGLDLELDGSCETEDSSSVSWQANLHDRFNGNRAYHPSALEHNAALSYDGGEYGTSWTPNLALARILLAASLLAAIQTIESRSLAAPAKTQFAGALPAPAA